MNENIILIGAGLGQMQTNCYIAGNRQTKEALVFDPGDEGYRVMEMLEKEGLELTAVLLTHGHFDHIMGIDGFLSEFDVPVYVHEEDADAMEDPVLNQSSTYTSGYTFDKALYLRDRQTLELAGYTFQVIHTPGHTKGGCCYYVASEGVLFSGDTLFQNSVGRTDFVNSSTSDLVHSVREKLFLLPDDTMVYPGHMGETKIGHEKKYNPYV